MIKFKVDYNSNIQMDANVQFPKNLLKMSFSYHIPSNSMLIDCVNKNEDVMRSSVYFISDDSEIFNIEYSDYKGQFVLDTPSNQYKFNILDVSNTVISSFDVGNLSVPHDNGVSGDLYENTMPYTKQENMSINDICNYLKK
ncbi:hypothetical protein FOI42_RS03180 [Escherichia coli]|nr:hypothetical protein [Escherichia coli]